MSSKDLKQKLIEEITTTEDTSVLMEILRILEINHDPEPVLKLSEPEKIAISEARHEIQRGAYYSEDEADQLTQEWLGK